MQFKVGRNTYQAIKGDYLMDNGRCIQFCTGDKRDLQVKVGKRAKNLTMTKKALSQIDLSKLRRVEEEFYELKIIYYFF